MESQYQELLNTVAEKAAQLQMEPEDLAVLIAEGSYLNCPEIYNAVSSFCTGENR